MISALVLHKQNCHPLRQFFNERTRATNSSKAVTLIKQTLPIGVETSTSSHFSHYIKMKRGINMGSYENTHRNLSHIYGFIFFFCFTEIELVRSIPWQFSYLVLHDS